MYEQIAAASPNDPTIQLSLGRRPRTWRLRDGDPAYETFPARPTIPLMEWRPEPAAPAGRRLGDSP
jgi:hypothetical protein